MNAPPLPQGDKFAESAPCVPGGPVVDSSLGTNGYMVCSGCRGIICLGMTTFNGFEWSHLP